jgi:hypothetical protein
MINAQAAKSAVAVNLLTCEGEIADTTAATGSYVAVPAAAAGYLIITQNVGTISTGTLIGTIETASDDQGADLATVATFTTVTTSDDAPNVQTVVLPATIGKYVRYKGTLSAGTGDIAVSMLYSPQKV